MKTGLRFCSVASLFLILVDTHAQDTMTIRDMPPVKPAEASTTTSTVAPTPPPDQVKVQMAVHQMQAHQLDDALVSLNEAIGINPQNQVPYFLRASIFASRKLWPAAEKDLLAAEAITPDDIDIEMFLGDVFLLEKKYDDASNRFAKLTADPNRGDLATYKVFVCDVLAGHNDAVAKQLNAFDHSQAKPSCYYAHAMSSLFNQKTEDGRRWLDSAAVLYGPAVTGPYAQCLRDLGYLPLPPKPGH